MDILSPLFSLVFRGLVVLMPLTTAWLALRRLILSRSVNAWVYALTCLFAAVTAAGIAPWALGLSRASGIFFVFSAFCPAIWIAVVILCDGNRRTHYDAESITDAVVTFRPSRRRPALVLENPDWPGTPVPVFRHGGAANDEPSRSARSQATVVETTRTLMAIAREMRGNVNSDARRPRLLPPPDIGELPFIKGSRSA